MKNKNIIVLFVVAILTVTGLTRCRPEESTLNPATLQERKEFVNQGGYGVYNKSGALLEFNNANHQLYSARKGRVTRITDSGGEQYFEITLKDLPGTGKFIGGSFTVTSGFAGSLSSSSSKDFYVLKRDPGNNRMWIWCDDLRFGAVMLLRDDK